MRPASRKLLALVVVAVVIAAVLSVAAILLLTGRPPEPTAVQLEVTSSNASPFAGQAFALTVRAILGNDSTATNYQGEVEFTSDDSLATLPQPTQFVAGDKGVKQFSSVIIRKIGSVTITVRDAALDISGSVALTGQRAPGAPVAAFEAIRTLMRVDVNGSASTDPDNDIATYEWDFDADGTFDSTGVTASHDYTASGVQTIRLRVSDARGNQDNATRKVSVATSTIDYAFSDFFNVPFQDYWDIRQLLYFERPINAECFNATSIAEGICTPSDPNTPDVASYPYTHWWSADPPGDATGVPYLYARYQIRADGANVPGYNLSEPVYLWVRDYSASPGNRLDLTWRMSYMNQTRADEVGTWCATNFVFGNDGYILESNINITMDLQESRRIFGVVAADPASAQTWWNSVTNPLCRTRGSLETAFMNWFVDLGGAQARIGKYDIATGYEWFYQPFTTNINATVDPASGTTWLNISHTAYGTEVLMARWFYWGNTSYKDNWADSTKRAGWIGMEIAWYEDLVFDARLGTSTHDFDLRTSMAYHFQNVCTPGANGQYDRTDDVSMWTLGPMLDDYVHDWQAVHTISELDRYTTETYTQCAAGSPASIYGTDVPLDVVPITWDLPAGHTLVSHFPTSNVVFYDPNLTPPGAIPTLGEFRVTDAPLQLAWTTPPAYGEWNPSTMTWSILGPISTGGPDGSPGNYALQPWPTINFEPGTAGVQAEGITASDAAVTATESEGGWPEAIARGLAEPFVPFAVLASRGPAADRETRPSPSRALATAKALWNVLAD